MMPEGYSQIRDGFSWHVPDHFNFGIDVVDRLAREGDGLALIWENEAGKTETYRFSDIARLSNKLANALRERGIQKGDRIIIMLPRIPAWPISMIAALKIGAVPIPCVEMLTDRDIAFRLQNSEARAAICRATQVQKFDARQLAAQFAMGNADGWDDFDAVIQSASDKLDPALLGAEDPALMYYTSGSTGYPKGVVHAARALFAWRVSAEYWLGLGPGDRIWCTADTGWAKAGTSILFGPWSMGACTFLFDGPFVASERLRLLAKHRISVYCAPGTELFRVLDANPAAADLGALRQIVSAGEALNPVIAERWQRITPAKIAEAYGQTETLMLAITPVGQPAKFGSMGLPSPGSDVDVIDDEGRRCPNDVEGTVALRVPNPQFMVGYWRDERRTRSCLLPGPDGLWYLTGDRARRDADGYLWFAGRNDDLINSSGYRIGPMEVENALLEHPAVAECAVIGSPDEQRGEIVKAFIVLRPEHNASDALIAELQQHAKRLTAPYKYPRAIEFIDALPRTATGKIGRRALRDREIECQHKKTA